MSIDSLIFLQNTLRKGIKDIASIISKGKGYQPKQYMEYIRYMFSIKLLLQIIFHM